MEVNHSSPVDSCSGSSLALKLVLSSFGQIVRTLIRSYIIFHSLYFRGPSLGIRKVQHFFYSFVVVVVSPWDSPRMPARKITQSLVQ